MAKYIVLIDENEQELHPETSWSCILNKPDLQLKLAEVNAGNNIMITYDANGNPVISALGTITDIERQTWNANTSSINTINGKIPNDASSSNQLADKAFVNSSISTSTSNFKGTLDVVADLGLSYGASNSQITNALNSHTFSPVATLNDYCFVINKDTSQNTIYERFKFSGSSWLYEYTLNNSSFTAVQWSAINSGATTTNIGQITTNANAISGIKNGTSINNFSGVEAALTGKLNASKCTFQTLAPIGNITDGGVHIVYLTSEPLTKYDGYIYLIKE